jgi:hypothetical protein
MGTSDDGVNSTRAGSTPHGRKGGRVIVTFDIAGEVLEALVRCLTPGPTADGATTPKIHAALEQRSLLPGTHIVDTGFLDADLFVKRQDDYGVDLLGPTRLDDH